MKVKKNYSLKVKFTVIVGAIVISALLATQIMGVISSNKILKNSILQSYRSETDVLSETISRMIETEKVSLEKYIESDDVRLIANGKATVEQEKKILDEFNKDKSRNASIDQIQIINKEAEIVFSTSENGKGIDVSERDYIIEAFEKKTSVVSDITRSKATNELANYIVEPIFDKNNLEVIGLISKSYTEKLYDEVLDKYQYGLEYIYMTDSKGNVVYHKDSERKANKIGIEVLDEIAINREDTSGVVEYYFDGARVAAYSQVPGLDWKIYKSDFTKELTKDTIKIVLAMALVGIVMLIISILVIWIVVGRLVKPIIYLNSKVSEIADGNLTIKVDDIKTGDEVEMLAKGIDIMAGNLLGIIEKLDSTMDNVERDSSNLSAITEEISAVNSEVSKAMDDIASGIVEQANDLEKTNNSAKELGGNIDKLSLKNIDMEVQGSKVVSSLEESQDKIKYLIRSNNETIKSYTLTKETVGCLIKSVNKISDIIIVIKEISNQTNLLSLNASIEAAKAGKAGYGFAVVAGEIKKLSEESKKATESIENIIIDIDIVVDNTNKSLDETSEISENQVRAFENMNSSFEYMEISLKGMLEITKEIAEEIEYVNERKEVVLEAVSSGVAVSQEIASVTEEVNASISEQMIVFNSVTDSSESLNILVNDAKQMIEVFIIKK